MRYLKSFELHSGHIIDYEEGDTVACIDFAASKWYRGQKVSGLEIGKLYKVIKIYTIPEDVFLGNKFARVDVQDLETGEISKGWESTRFKSELEFDADKYNM